MNGLTPFGSRGEFIFCGRTYGGLTRLDKPLYIQMEILTCEFK